MTQVRVVEVEVGEVLVVEVEVPGGGTSGVGGGSGVQHVATPISFDDVGLSSPSGNILGVTVWEPSVGDVLVDAWFSITTAWDASAKFDFYLASTSGSSGFSGAYGSLNTISPPQPSASSVADAFGQIFQGDTATALGGPSVAGYTKLADLVNIVGPADLLQAHRLLPALFEQADPLVLVISDDGLANGDDPGATAGAGVVHVLYIPA